MFVITADQDDSRRSSDRVPALLAALVDLTHDVDGVALPFERTVGDEVQGVLTDAGTTLTIALALQRRQEWSVGIGVGTVHTPLAETARASTGPAFLHARDAVERAKGRTVPVPIALAAADPAPAAECEALLHLITTVVRRRSDAGWEAVDLLASGSRTAKDVAEELGISPQAVSSRLRTAMWEEERAVHPLAVRLLADLDSATAG
ncbi:hypothetical protein [Ruania alba]|uniref:SatD family (SatD) n=1 Tax=Ruania alba TaxID=648782 RepID=A0A1H5FUK2_9MICO|nr:hypothetical protein [Ruania alba]SEE06568.1 hypothetical protein SAMN04488554_1438 [Ruania alba]